MGRAVALNGMTRDPVVASARRYLLVLFALATLLALMSAMLMFVPGFLAVAVAPEVDDTIHTAVTLVAGATAVLAWIRFRESAEVDSLFQAAAFLVLCVGNAIVLILAVSGLEDQFGFSPADPGQAPLYLWTFGRYLAAPLLLAGAVIALRTNPGTPSAEPLHTRRALLAVIAPTMALLVISAAILAAPHTLPALIEPSALAELVRPRSAATFELTSVPMLLTQIGAALIFLAAAVIYGLAFVKSGGHRPHYRFLAVGLIVAAFSQLHFAIAPAVYSNLWSTGDVLRLLFYGIVGVGIAAAAREDLVELRLANETLQRLRAADNERIALSERARLAREIHDGLVQELWLARLTHGRLVRELHQHGQREDLRVPRELDESAAAVDRALENALAEARQAVVTLQPNPDPSFGSLLRRFVEDFGDRFGLEVECIVESESISMSGDVQAQVLRICREALNNARKHADATLVRVMLTAVPGAVRLAVTDNGKGFDPEETGRSGYGMRSMHERATEIGARLTVDSAPMDGTRVTLEMPA